MIRRQIGSMAIALVMGAAIGISGAVAVSAQEATPAASPESITQFPITVDPASCSGEPVMAEDLLALWYSPEGEQLMATPETGMEASEGLDPDWRTR